jgi:hypothetical protein
MSIDFENDRMQSVEQIDSAKKLSDKIIELKDLEDEIGGSGFEPIQKIGVNPMTLKALVRERLESGQDVPADLFKPFEGNQTKITRR